MPRIVLCFPVEPVHIQQIAEAAPGYDVMDAGQERIAQAIFEADIFCGHPKVPMDWDGVVQQGRLQWIQSSAAGLDHLLMPSVIGSSIVITSASGVLGDQVSEHCLALTLGWLRRLPRFLKAQADREFIRRPTLDVHGKTIGIVGFGGVGRRIAQVFRVFKTKIIAVDMFPEACPPLADETVHFDQLDAVLPRVSILILSTPLTPQSRGMMNLRRLSLLSKNALLVNMGRGPLVVESDLVKALQSQMIAGACMDVTEKEPLSPESPLWSMDNVIITPHVAGQCERRAGQMTDFFCANLKRYLRGEPLRNLVDKTLGFPRPENLAWPPEA